MKLVLTAEDGTDPIGEFLGAEQAVGLDHFALGVDPARLDRVEPGTLDRQVAGDDPNALPLPLDSSVVLVNPGPDLAADVPGGVVPGHQERGLAKGFEPTADPVEELGRDRRDRPTVDEAQPDLLPDLRLAIGSRVVGLSEANEDAVASQRLRIGIVLGERLLDQAQGLVVRRPRQELREREPTPPGLVLEAQRPVGMTDQETDQAIASPFFRAYSGAGLVIQFLARLQPTSSRLSVARIVSSLTRYGVIPWRKLTSAASSSVQRLVGLPKRRGLWWRRALSRSAASESSTRRVLWGADEPLTSEPSPDSLKETIALRTVWSSQPRLKAILGAHSPLAEASTIWQRRSTKASEERRPAASRWRSSSVS